eukprot:gene23255-biopygen22299
MDKISQRRGPEAKAAWSRRRLPLPSPAFTTPSQRPDRGWTVTSDGLGHLVMQRDASMQNNRECCLDTIRSRFLPADAGGWEQIAPTGAGDQAWGTFSHATSFPILLGVRKCNSLEVSPQNTGGVAAEDWGTRQLYLQRGGKRGAGESVRNNDVICKNNIVGDWWDWAARTVQTGPTGPVLFLRQAW